VKGRKKNRAEKYDPTDGLTQQWAKAYAGKLSDCEAWMWVLEYCGHLIEADETKEKNEKFWKKSPQFHPKRKLAEWCAILLDQEDPDKAANELQQLAASIRAAADLKARGVKYVDGHRMALLEANDRLHQDLADRNLFAGSVKKNDLVKCVQKLDLFTTMDQPGVLRMMRELGLPRWPEYLRPISYRTKRMIEREERKLRGSKN
jgi:hypothetical protein